MNDSLLVNSSIEELKRENEELKRENEELKRENEELKRENEELKQKKESKEENHSYPLHFNRIKDYWDWVEEQEEEKKLHH